MGLGDREVGWGGAALLLADGVKAGFPLTPGRRGCPLHRWADMGSAVPRGALLMSPCLGRGGMPVYCSLWPPAVWPGGLYAWVPVNPVVGMGRRAWAVLGALFGLCPWFFWLLTLWYPIWDKWGWRSALGTPCCVTSGVWVPPGLPPSLPLSLCRLQGYSLWGRGGGRPVCSSLVLELAGRSHLPLFCFCLYSLYLKVRLIIYFSIH